MQELVAGMLLVPARPLDAPKLVEPRVGHAGMHRRQRAQLVPDVFRARAAEVVAEATGELVDDLDVVARLAGRVERLADALHPPLAGRDRPLRLGPAGGAGEHDVGELRGPRQEEVLDDEMVEPGEEAHRALLVRLRLRGVLADDIHRAQLAVLHRLEHAGEVQPALRRDLGAPHGLELRARDRILDVLEPGQLVRDRAHVAAALHVVLAAQRLQPGAEPADAADEQREVDEREDVVDRVVVLGDAERPAQLRVLGAPERVRELADRRRGDAGDALGLVERPRLDRLAEGVDIPSSHERRTPRSRSPPR